MWPGLVGRITVKLGPRAVAGHLQLATRLQHSDISMVTISRNSASLFLIGWCRISLAHYLLFSSHLTHYQICSRKMHQKNVIVFFQ